MSDRTLRHSLAAAAPLLCAIHCALTPVLVAVLPAFAVGEGIERSLFGMSASLAGWALMTGLRVHRDPRPAIVAGIGLLAWAMQLLGVAWPAAGEGVVAAAALVVAAALIANARLRHVAEDRACACSACGHPEAS